MKNHITMRLRSRRQKDGIARNASEKLEKLTKYAMLTVSNAEQAEFVESDFFCFLEFRCSFLTILRHKYFLLLC